MLSKVAIPFASAALGGLMVFLLLPRAGALPRNFQADRITLNGVSGLPTVIISGGGDRGPSVILMDAEFRPRATLAVPGDGNPSIQLGQGGGRIFLTAEDGGVSALTVRDGSGRDRVRIRVGAGGDPVVEAIGAAGIERLQPR